MSYISGFCGIGAHEGTSPTNKDDKPLPTCKMSSDVCDCKCHTDLDTMFKMSEMDRITVDRSGYIPDRGDFVMPSLNEIAEARRLATPTVTLERIESPDPALVPATVRRTFTPTPTGRSGRGELEQQVDATCKIWLIDNTEWPCTPKYVSEQIEKEYGIKAPSVGAIGAVFDRWSAMGYATCERKPVRFIGFTDLGRKLGLHGCKEKARRQRVK